MTRVSHKSKSVIDLRDTVNAAESWFVRMRSETATADDKEKFELWLSTDPANRIEYEKVVRLWDGMKEFETQEEIETLQQPFLSTYRRRRQRRWSSYGTAAALVVLSVAVLLFNQNNELQPTVFTTGIGEQRMTALPDGSTVNLNTRTILQVMYTKAERKIILTDGQAFFSVAHDQQRPFIVHAGDTTMRALGTEFDVYREDEFVKVAVISGMVEVTASNFSQLSKAIITRKVERGKQVTLHTLENDREDKPDIVIEAADIDSVTSWRTGKLVFDQSLLIDAVREFNRYSRNKIIIGDDRLNTLEVSGIFRVTASDDFVESLPNWFPVSHHKSADNDWVLSYLEKSEE